MKTLATTSFKTTSWTTLLEAAKPGSPGGQEAIAALYQDYWRPLYSYVRKRGYSAADAEDVTQDFFVALLGKQRLTGLTREGRRFRSFLLAALKNHLANVWDRAHAARRGCGQIPLPLDVLDAEEGYQAGFATQPDADRVFARHWAQTLLERARSRLESECAGMGKGPLFAALRNHLQGDGEGRAYTELASQLGLTEGALRVAAHRLRRRFGEVLRAEVEFTVENPAEVQGELRELIQLVGATS